MLDRRSLLLALVLPGLCILQSLPLVAQARYLALGDSITDGYGESYPDVEPDHGYPSRLEDLLDNAVVIKRGFGGVNTAELLDEADPVFAANPADVLLLMVGTNDVTQRRTGSERSLSEETSLFNLQQIASRAAAFGMDTVHATVIPRPRIAKQDPDNIDNQSFNQGVRDLAGDRGRRLVDNFEVWMAETRPYPRLYLVDDPQDFVGHPNADGYDLMARTFAQVLKGSDRVPPVPGVMSPKKGEFDVPANTLIRLELWDFGEGIDIPSVVLRVNGRAVAAVKTGNSRNLLVRYQPLAPLEGVVSLELAASDLASPPNSTDREIATFTITGTVQPGDYDADIDGNGAVDGFDFFELLIAFGADPSMARYDERADINEDGLIDGYDLAILGFNFGRTPDDE